MYQSLAKANPHHEDWYASPKTLGLPDGNTSTSASADVAKVVAAFESVNSAVDEAVFKASITSGHFPYDEETRAKIAKHDSHGATKNAEPFSKTPATSIHYWCRIA